VHPKAWARLYLFGGASGSDVALFEEKELRWAIVWGQPDPKVEADWIAQTLHGEVVMVPEAGHYPQSQRPDLTKDAVVRFLETVNGSG